MSLLLGYLFIYLSIYLSKRSRLRRRKCRSTTRAPNNVTIKRPGEIKMFKMTSKGPFIATQLNSTQLDVELSWVVSLQTGLKSVSRLHQTVWRYSLLVWHCFTFSFIYIRMIRCTNTMRQIHLRSFCWRRCCLACGWSATKKHARCANFMAI